MIRLAALILAAWPGAALACACCAEKGERFDYQIEMQEWELRELASRDVAQPAYLFVTACDLDCAKGIAGPQYKYGVEIAYAEAGVEFDLSDETGTHRGTIGLDWPTHYTYFGVDTDPMAAPPDPMLYLEMRLDGEAYGTGDFEQKTPLKAELIFSGRGNMCFSAGALTHWVLSITGDGVEYRLFGALSTP